MLAFARSLQVLKGRSMGTDGELIFEVREAEEGGFWARALGTDIFAQADTWEELRMNVQDAVRVHFESPGQLPRIIRLHFVRDEVLTL